LRYARLVQPFRSHWMLLWDAPNLAAMIAGTTPTESPHAIAQFPPDYWRYRHLAAGVATEVEEDTP
jgi:hypothetical protein